MQEKSVFMVTMQEMATFGWLPLSLVWQEIRKIDLFWDCLVGLLSFRLIMVKGYG